MTGLRYFDRDADYWVTWRRLPHWSQPGTISFITWRTEDSMPRPVVARWVAERDALLRQHNIRPNTDWRRVIRELPRSEQDRVKWQLTERWDRLLDECHGACVLKQPSLAQIVSDSLHFFDADRYTLTDFVIMPNHVHLCAAFRDEQAMLKQCGSWKRFTAVRINRKLGRRGQFWQEDAFDHLIRSEDQFMYYRRYIAENPRRARLATGEYLWYSKQV